MDPSRFRQSLAKHIDFTGQDNILLLRKHSKPSRVMVASLGVRCIALGRGLMVAGPLLEVSKTARCLSPRASGKPSSSAAPMCTKVFLSYLHERAWARIPLGTIRRYFRRDESVPEVAGSRLGGARSRVGLKRACWSRSAARMVLKDSLKRQRLTADWEAGL